MKLSKYQMRIMKYPSWLINLIYLGTTTFIILVGLFVPYTVIGSNVIETDKKVAAFYYGWYSNDTDFSQTNPYLIEDTAQWAHWNCPGYDPPINACSTFTPELGWYDSADPYVLEKHLKDAEWAGIDAFICSYWGYNGFEFRNIENLLRVADAINSNLSFSLYFETSMGNLPEEENNQIIETLSTELEYIYDFFTTGGFQDLIWMEDEKPVLFAYVVRDYDASVWSTVIDDLANNDKEFFLVADRPGDKPEYNRNFEGSHQYDVYYPTYHDEYLETFLNIKINCETYDQLFIAGVSPGYDDHKVRDGHPALLREKGNTYVQSWETAISLNPNWITITSWNEWHEGTEIEPSIENSDLALNQTKIFIEEFKSGQYNALTPKRFYAGMIIHMLVALAISWLIWGIYALFSKKGLERLVKLNKPLALIFGILALLISVAGPGYFLIAEIINHSYFEVSGELWSYLLIAAQIANIVSIQQMALFLGEER
ncbi:MAG: hypothetical protein GF364_11105 [Candidatus Lokiarchaeota archaeon]|nr:hypothetical protein [Candidatus Lokiarchaeota archaeon]